MSELDLARQQTARLRRRTLYLSAVLGIILILSSAAIFFENQRGNQRVSSVQTAEAQALTQLAQSEATQTQALAQAQVHATAEAVAVAQRDAAEQQARRAFSRQLAAQALLQVDEQLDLSLLLSLEAFRVADTTAAQSSLLAGLQHNPRLITSRRNISRLVFSPNGKIAASNDGEGGVILWDVSIPASMARLGTLPLPDKYSVGPGVAFRPDGQVLAAGESGGAIVLWDVSQPASPVILGTEHPQYWSAGENVTFSPDGKLVALGGCAAIDEVGWCSRAEIILWDVSDPALPRILDQLLTGSRSGLDGLAFSPNGKLLASGGCSLTKIDRGCIRGEIQLWNVSKSGTAVTLGTRLVGHADFVSSLAFSPDGKVLASGGRENTIQLWNLSNPFAPVALGKTLEGAGPVLSSLAFSPDGKILAAGSCGEDDRNTHEACTQGDIQFWDVSLPRSPVSLGTPLGVLSEPVESVAFSPDGKTFVSGGCNSSRCDKGEIRLWDVSDFKTPPVLGSWFRGHKGAVASTAFHPTGKVLASGSDDSTLRLWDVSNPHGSVLLSQPRVSYRFDTINSLAFSPDGKTLAAGSRDGTIWRWEVSNPQAPIPLEALTHCCNPDEVTSLAFNPDGTLIASGLLWDASIEVWDLSPTQAERKLAASLGNYHDQVNSVAFSPDGKLLAGGSEDGTWGLWDISIPQLPVILYASPLDKYNPITQVAFSPDGKLLAVGSRRSLCGCHPKPAQAILWDIANPHSPVALGAPLEDPFNSLAFRPDGKMLASGQCYISDYAHGDCLTGAIQLWDISSPESSEALETLLQGTGARISGITFSSDGKVLASGDQDGRIILWDVDINSWEDRACRLAGRNLTRVEWVKYFGAEPYHKTCAQWPEEE